MMLRSAALLLALAASSLARGEALDPPERFARLSYVEGHVALQGADEPAYSTLPDRSLIPGDRLMTEDGGRAELAFGTATVRLDERTEVVILDLDATAVRIELNRGTASVHLREQLENETFEVLTPNTRIAFREPGEYRVEVPAEGTTELTVHGGAAEAATGGGPVRVAAGQRVRLEGREAFASLSAPLPADAFDEWVLGREVQLAEMEPSREQLLAGDEYEDLDRYGDWYDEPRYGRVWMPSYAYGGWSPFSYGHWQRVGYGWSWFNPLPWNAFTFHSGRWTFLHHLNRWCWVPSSRIHHRDRVAHDTAPFGRPRGDASPRVDRRPVATIQESPRRIDADRVPVYRRDVESIKPPRTESAPKPQGGTATMRPSRPSESRREASSRPATTTHSAFGVPQTP